MGSDTFYLESQRAEQVRHRENSARLAMAFAKFESQGQGTVEFEERVDFGLTFIQEPYITYGCQIDLDEFAELIGVAESDTPVLPQSTGYVTEWDIDDRGFYTGAWMAATVFDPTGVLPTGVEMLVNHHFTFTAVAIKDVPLDVTD